MNPQHAAYLKLLARWNATVNLTSLQVDPPDTDAIERLIDEPLRATPFVRQEDRFAIDIGSGGGSPALPLKIACPWLRYVLVESRKRKCAFLREAVRELGLRDVEVLAGRFEDLASGLTVALRADVITCRAVRLNDQLWTAIWSALAPSGRLLWFGGDSTRFPPTFRLHSEANSLLVLAPAHAKGSVVSRPD